MGRYGAPHYQGHGHGNKRQRRQRTPPPAAIPSAAFTRAYEAELVRGDPPPPRLIQWGGDGDGEVWADR